MAHPEPHMDTRHRLSLWFGLLGGPFVWAVHFLLSYGLIEIACRTGLWMDFTVLGLSGVSFVVLLLTLAAILATACAGWLAHRNEPRTQDGEPGQAEERSAFMAHTGVLLCGLFGVLVLLGGISALVLRPCG